MYRTRFLHAMQNTWRTRRRRLDSSPPQGQGYPNYGPTGNGQKNMCWFYPGFEISEIDNNKISTHAHRTLLRTEFLRTNFLENQMYRLAAVLNIRLMNGEGRGQNHITHGVPKSGFQPPSVMAVKVSLEIMARYWWNGWYKFLYYSKYNRSSHPGFGGRGDPLVISRRFHSPHRTAADRQKFEADVLKTVTNSRIWYNEILTVTNICTLFVFGTNRLKTTPSTTKTLSNFLTHNITSTFVVYAITYEFRWSAKSF